MAGLGLLLLALLLLVRWPEAQAGRVVVPPAPAQGDGRSGDEWTVSAAMRTTAFWGLASVFLFTGAGMFSIMVQAVAYLVELGYPPLQAASIYGLIGVLTPIGIIGFAWADGRIGRHASAALSYAFSLTGLASLWALKAHQNIVFLSLFVLLVGLSFGARGPMVGATAARIFQGRRFGAIFGTIMVGSGVGVSLGTFIGAALHDWTGGYTAVFLFSGFCVVMGALPFWSYRSLRAYGP
jgi:MFS family permease